MRTRPAATAALLFVLTACAGDDSDADRTSQPPGAPAEAPSQTEGGGGLPSCANVWVPGETLAADYNGCELANGTTYPAVGIPCKDGSGRLFAFDQQGSDADEFFALSGDEIQESADAQAYASAFSACMR